MKLYYANPPSIRNFGDDLNPWIWDRLLPGTFSHENGDAMFVGIGTLINDRLPASQKTVVFSSGVGFGKDNRSWSLYYGRGLPENAKSFTYYCVRGPLSADALQLPEEMAVTDGAALVRRLYRPSGKKNCKFAYMPHALFARDGENSWEKICGWIGFKLIDPRNPIETVLRDISETKVLLTEAMHGAIVADALRVPWVPVHTNPVIYPFKWMDWCASLQVDYRPHHLRPYKPLKDPKRSGKLNFPRKKWFKLVWYALQMRLIGLRSKPSLSREAVLEQRVGELEKRLEAFRKDFDAGLFNT
jgi:succinoglycan biosynthesis protein ExoV